MALLDGDERAQLRAAQTGSASDFEALVRAHWPRSYRAAYLVMLDQVAAEEVAEEAFLAAIRRLDRFDGDHPFVPWLHRTVVGASTDRARARAGRQAFATGEPPGESTEPLGWEIPLAGPHTPPDVRSIALGLASLRSEERAAVVLRLVLGYSAGDAASVLEAPKKTVAAALDRGLAGLRGQLRDRGELKDAQLGALLLAQPVPGEQLAQERTWEVLRRTFDSREPFVPRRRWPVKTLVLLGLVAAGLAIGLSPVGATIADWFQDELGRDRVVTVAPPAQRPTLPADGRLLVAAGGQVDVLDRDGRRVPLGRYRGAAWSTSGQFVAAWRSSELVGVDPAEPELPLWQVDGKAIADARWSGDDFRVAYRSGRALRVIDGNGDGDRRLARGIAPVAPAWLPGDDHVLAYADREGRVRVVDADSGKLQWQARAAAVVELSWLADGSALAILAPSELRLLAGPRSAVAAVRLPAEVAGTAIAPRPGSTDVAYAVYSAGARTTSVFLLDARSRTSRLLFTGAGRIGRLVWSPDGMLLLVPWRSAGQWLFVPAAGDDMSSIPDVAGALGGPSDAFPRPDGWCCPAG